MKSIQTMAIGALLVLLPATQAIAGSAPASISCTATSKASSMKIEGTIPADETVLDLKVSSREGSYALTDADRVTITQELRDGVFTMSIRHKDGTIGALDIHALPKTVKYQGGNRWDKASFDARLTAIRPSKYLKKDTDYYEYDDYVRRIPVKCQYDYSI